MPPEEPLGPWRSLRSETVRELGRIVDKEIVVHVRGTPASGKSTLADLLNRHYHSQNVPSLIILGWPKPNEKPDYTSILVGEANNWGYRFVTRNNLKDSTIVFILDEAQMSYHDLKLWMGMIEMQIDRHWGVRFCLFSSYGSPGTGPADDMHPETPLGYLGPEQRVSITVSKTPGSTSISLFYNRNEFDDVVLRESSRLKLVPLREEAKDYLFTLTNGHPGAVEAVLYMLQQVSGAVYFRSRSLTAYGMRCTPR